MGKVSKFTVEEQQRIREMLRENVLDVVDLMERLEMLDSISEGQFLPNTEVFEKLKFHVLDQKFSFPARGQSVRRKPFNLGEAAYAGSELAKVFLIVQAKLGVKRRFKDSFGEEV